MVHKCRAELHLIQAIAAIDVRGAQTLNIALHHKCQAIVVRFRRHRLINCFIGQSLADFPINDANGPLAVIYAKRNAVVVAEVELPQMIAMEVFGIVVLQPIDGLIDALV